MYHVGSRCLPLRLIQCGRREQQFDLGSNRMVASRGSPAFIESISELGVPPGHLQFRLCAEPRRNAA